MKVYNGSHEKLESSDVIKDSQVNVIVQLYGIWFTQSRFGLTWRLHQIKVNTPTKKHITVYLKMMTNLMILKTCFLSSNFFYNIK